MSLLLCTSRAISTERMKHQLSCLHWNKFTTVYQTRCLHWKEKRQPSSLLWDEFTTVYQPSCLYWKERAKAQPFALLCVYNSVPAELFALKGYSTSRAICIAMSLQQCTSRAVCTERIKHKLSSLYEDRDYNSVPAVCRLHWKDKAAAKLFALKQVYKSVPAELFALKGKCASRAVSTEMNLL